MSAKIGRNDPCHCGSGRKFKHCHGRPLSQAPSDDHAKVIDLALSWLEQRHRKAYQEEVKTLIFDEFWPDEDPDPAEVPGDYWGMIHLNVCEWLLASGELNVKGKRVPVIELLLGPGGLRLGPRQQGYLQQLASNPLRLYEVTDSRPGQGITLVDVLAEDAEPVQIQERTASQTLRAGMLMGTRVVAVDDHFELSGALYPFSPLHAGELNAALPEFLAHLSEQGFNEDEATLELGYFIVERWFEQMTLPAPMPEFVDASTGEPMMLTTDHFRIVDREMLVEKLAASAELGQQDEGHWAWVEESSDGQLRARLTLTIEPSSSDRIQLFCRTKKLADEGRAWFEALAGDSVKYLTRELTDPKGAITAGGESRPSRPAEPPDIPPEEMTRILQESVKSIYADWADQPLPALGDRTPRDAMATSGGLERVKGLLRSYDQSEQELAREQGRKPVSFQFLWDDLGISRD